MQTASVVALKSSLPRITLENDGYVIDRQAGEVRETASPHGKMGFDEFELALTLAGLAIFHDGGAEAEPAQAAQLIASAEAFDRALGNDPADRRHSLNVIMANGADDDSEELAFIQRNAHRI
jgi:hypothetical protein